MIFFRRQKFDVRRFGSRELRLRINKAHAAKRTFGAGPRRFARTFLWLKPARIWKTGLVILGLPIFYFLFVGNELLITDVAFAGHRQVSAQRLAEVLKEGTAGRTFFIKQSHYLLMTEGRLNRLFSLSVGEIRRVSSNRKWPRGISIAITERNPGFVFKTAGKSYLVDDEGVVIKEAADPALPEVLNLNNDEIKIGDAIPSPKLSTFILSMHRTWPLKINSAVAGIKITKIGSNDIQFDSKETWSAFFDINRSAVSQLNNLATILNKQVAAKDRPQLAYIDLRSEKWVYYCFRNTPCSSAPVPVINNENP